MSLFTRQVTAPSNTTVDPIPPDITSPGHVTACFIVTIVSTVAGMSAVAVVPAVAAGSAVTAMSAVAVVRSNRSICSVGSIRSGSRVHSDGSVHSGSNVPVVAALSAATESGDHVDTEPVVERVSVESGDPCQYRTSSRADDG